MVNFASSQFCKRCNLSLGQFQASVQSNETQLIVNDTAFRQITPPRGFAENNNDTYSYSSSADHRAYQSNEWSLPHFPQEERQQYYDRQAYTEQQFSPPPQFNQSHQSQGFSNSYGYMSEPMIRRFGNDIALHKNGNLPSFCVKCGKSIASQFDGLMVAEKFRWHNPLVYIALISPLIYLILALALSQRFTVNTPLCHQHFNERQKTKNFMIGGAVLLIPLIIISGSWGYAGFAFLLFFAGLIGLPLMHTYLYKSLTIKSVEGNYYHLKGASPDFLSRVPY